MGGGGGGEGGEVRNGDGDGFLMNIISSVEKKSAIVKQFSFASSHDSCTERLRPPSD